MHSECTLTFVLLFFQFPPSPSNLLQNTGSEFFKAANAVGGGTVVNSPRIHSASGPSLTASKQCQTDLTCQRIQEFETQASSDLELRNNKIDELTRTSDELRHQVSAQQKVCIELPSVYIFIFVY